ncbi:MAG: hypothetical protein ACOYNI_03115 [Acidimicrobiia bacterium]
MLWVVVRACAARLQQSSRDERGITLALIAVSGLTTLVVTLITVWIANLVGVSRFSLLWN